MQTRVESCYLYSRPKRNPIKQIMCADYVCQLLPFIISRTAFNFANYYLFDSNFSFFRLELCYLLPRDILIINPTAKLDQVKKKKKKKLVRWGKGEVLYLQERERVVAKTPVKIYMAVYLLILGASTTLEGERVTLRQMPTIITRKYEGE